MSNANLPDQASHSFGDLSHLEPLAQAARSYARDAKAENTNRAYASDWRHYSLWCARQGVPLLPPNPQVLGLYITDGVSASKPGAGPSAVATIERRLSALIWNFRQRGHTVDRSDSHIREVLAGIRRRHGQPPRQKDALSSEDLTRMLALLGHDLRGLRDRAILLLGFAGGLRRSEIVGLDRGADQTAEGTGWGELLDDGLMLHIKGKTGWREVAIGKGTGAGTCPLAALKIWLEFAKIEHGPIFRPVSRDGQRVSTERLTDKHVARLVQQTALAAGLRGDLPEEERRLRFGGHSLRAGLATSADVDERHVQKHLGHASAEMTRRYQRQRDMFRINLTRAAGL